MDLMVAARYIKHKSILEKLEVDENVLQMQLEDISIDLSNKQKLLEFDNNSSEAEKIKMRNEISILLDMKEKISSELQITMDKVNYYGSKHSANKNLYIAESIDNHLETSEEYINRFRKQKIYLNVPKYKAADKKVISVEEAKPKILHLENLFTMDENIFLNNKLLSMRDKERALKILKLIFIEDREE